MDTPAAPLCPALAGVLASGRAHFNARVAQAGRRYPRLDTAAFAGFVRSALDPLTAGVEASAPQATAAVVMAAFDLALELVGQGLAGHGARTARMDRAWAQLAPRCASLLASAPTRLLGLLSNAVVQLEAVPTARVDAWIDNMTGLADQADTIAQWQALGQVLAWRAGLAHFRDGALAAADSLPEPLALQATAAAPGSSWSAVRDGYRADRWWSPEPALRAAVADGVACGDFTGFGGRFAQPPEVRVGAQGFVVRSAERYFLLVADVYGAVLLPAVAAEFEHAHTGASASVGLSGATVRLGERYLNLDLPPTGLAVCASADTVAISSSWTHAIRLLPCR